MSCAGLLSPSASGFWNAAFAGGKKESGFCFVALIFVARFVLVVEIKLISVTGIGIQPVLQESAARGQ